MVRLPPRPARLPVHRPQPAATLRPSMHFSLIDQVLEVTATRIVAVKNVTMAEEYLGDHFPGFPVLPGVLMVETLVQAARLLLDEAFPDRERHVLGGVKALRYGNFVSPGESLRVEVVLEKQLPDGSLQFKGTGRVVRPAGAGAADASADADTAISGRFTMRPVRTHLPVAAAGPA